MNKPSRRQELYNLLGDLPSNEDINCKLIAVEEREHYILEKLLLDLNGLEKVPAYFVRPKEKGPFPVVLFNHSHGGFYHLGKDELLNGNVYLQNPPYADQLAKMGYSAFCIDMWGFGERRGQTESEIFKHFLWTGRVMWGMMVYDNLRAIDYLVSREVVDADRIGTIGISMGSTMAWWTAALDTRIKACIDICCLTDFHDLIDSRGLDSHGIYYYVPRLLNHFTATEINALIAPRAHLSLAGNYDKLTPPAGLSRIDDQLKKLYAEEGVPDNWKLLRYDVGHLETADMRDEIVSFLKSQL
jgi:pimeloyl-ACP methyl ester carboxylesterase